ncbi:MAG: hypothetical protein ACM3PT_13570 [Deltaproteobacteria bacterium]
MSDIEIYAYDIESLSTSGLKLPLSIGMNYFSQDYIVISSQYRYYSDDFTFKKSVYKYKIISLLCLFIALSLENTKVK